MFLTEEKNKHLKKIATFASVGLSTALTLMKMF